MSWWYALCQFIKQGFFASLFLLWLKISQPCSVYIDFLLNKSTAMMSKEVVNSVTLGADALTHG